jgi:OOP family OmpA-OmpF porin
MVLASFLAILATSGVSADGDQPWHISYQIGGAKLDSDRPADESDAWHSVGFGRFFGNNLSLDFEYDQYRADMDPGYLNSVAPGAEFDEWRLSNWGGMLRYHVGQRNVRPYFALGIGRQKHRSVLHEGYATSLSAGIGLQGQFSKHWSGRIQALYRLDNDSNSLATQDKFSDLYVSIGLNFDFGGKAAPPPPPPPEPEPAPPPPPPPNPDLDGDGVLNERDKCPNTRPGAVVDLDGCEVEAVIELEGVHFDFDKATLRPDAIVILNEAAALLQKHERVVVEVAGHTDSKGSEEYNLGLSDRRATAVKDYLTSKGVKASRLSARGYGESRPVASNDTEAGRAENRRVELIILDR